MAKLAILMQPYVLHCLTLKIPGAIAVENISIACVDTVI